jgi:hypothetical protein
MEEEIHVGIARPRTLDGEGLDLLEPGDGFVELGLELPVAVEERKTEWPSPEDEEVRVSSGSGVGIEDHLDDRGR